MLSKKTLNHLKFKYVIQFPKFSYFIVNIFSFFKIIKIAYLCSNFYLKVINTQSNKLDDSMFESLIEIENLAKSKGLDSFLLKSFICPRNIYYLQSIQNKVLNFI